MFSDNSLVSRLNKNLKNLAHLENLWKLQYNKNENMFMFDANFYTQTERVAIDSPIGRILSNIFICHHEKLWLKQCPTPFKPHIYKKYVDDIFLLFNDIKHLELFQ